MQRGTEVGVSHSHFLGFGALFMVLFLLKRSNLGIVSSLVFLKLHKQDGDNYTTITQLSKFSFFSFSIIFPFSLPPLAWLYIEPHSPWLGLTLYVVNLIPTVTMVSWKKICKIFYIYYQQMWRSCCQISTL